MSEESGEGLELGQDFVPGRGFMLWQITNAWQRAIRGSLATTGLTYVQTVLLAGLAEGLAAGYKMSQANLAQTLGTDVMMTSQVLRALEADGLVRRDRDPADTRARIITLTEAGQSKVEMAIPLLRQVDEEFFDALGRHEERFAKGLRRLWRKRRLAGLRAAEPAPPDERPTPKRRAKV